MDIRVSLKPIHSSFLLPFLRYARRTTGNSTGSNLKMTHSASCGPVTVYDCARDSDEALQIAHTLVRAQSKEDSFHPFTTLPLSSSGLLGLLITTSIWAALVIHLVSCLVSPGWNLPTVEFYLSQFYTLETTAGHANWLPSCSHSQCHREAQRF